MIFFPSSSLTPRGVPQIEVIYTLDANGRSRTSLLFLDAGSGWLLL